MPKHVPAIRVGGVPIPPVWDGSDTAALAEVSIPWGRDALFDDPSVSTLKFSVIDPEGAWSGNPLLYDQRVTIELPDMGGRIIYQGDINGVTSRRRRITAPGQAEPEWVWVTEITAADPIAALDRAKPPGPMRGLGDNIGRAWLDWYGPGYWNGTTPEDRASWIMNHGGAGSIASIDTTLAGASRDSWVQLISADDAPSLLSVLRLGFHGRAAGHCNYNPATNGVAVGMPPAAVGLRLAYTAGTLILATTGGTAHLIPAGRIGVPKDGVAVTSAVGEAIDQVTVMGYNYDQTAWLDTDGKTFFTSKRASSPAPYTAQVPGRAPRNREVRWETNLALGTTGGSPSPTGPAAMLRSELVNLVASVNGKTAPAGLYYDWERHPPLDASIEELLFTTYDTPKSIYFVGAYTSGFPNLGPFYQLIGGTLSYDQGWRIDMRLTVAPSIAGTPVTYTNWVTSPAATYADFDPRITWGDFGAVTQGAS